MDTKNASGKAMIRIKSTSPGKLFVMESEVEVMATHQAHPARDAILPRHDKPGRHPPDSIHLPRTRRSVIRYSTYLPAARPGDPKLRHRSRSNRLCQYPAAAGMLGRDRVQAWRGRHRRARPPLY